MSRMLRRRYQSMAEEFVDHKEACRAADSVYNREMGELRNQLDESERRRRQSEGAAETLRTRLTDALHRASSADRLRHELVRAKEEIARYEAHAVRMADLSKKQGLAAAGPGEGERDTPGPSAGRAAAAGLPPHAVRSVIRATIEVEDSDTTTEASDTDDEITVLAEKKGRIVVIPNRCKEPSSLEVETGDTSDENESDEKVFDRKC